MNTKSAFITCHCRHCNGKLEFEPADVGETITCPICGLDTLLYIPRHASWPPEWVINNLIVIRRAVVLIVIATVALFLLPFVLAGFDSATAGSGDHRVGAILWVAFAVFLCFRLSRIEKVLAQIEINTRSH